MTNPLESIARDTAAVAHISAVPALLKLVCQNTRMGFSAVVRVTGATWTACAVRDEIQLGWRPGDRLQVEAQPVDVPGVTREPVFSVHAGQDLSWSRHHMPTIDGVASCISAPIVRSNGEYFGNLCAMDRRPRSTPDARTMMMFTVLADLIALQLDSADRESASDSALLDERATSNLREQFIAVLGHDLRNPLAAVGATAEILARRTHEPDLVKMGQRLRATTRRMSKLIDDVLDFARGRMGDGIGVTLEDVPDLAGALRDVVLELREANPGRILMDQGIAIDRPAYCDKGRVQQLLSNLLGNALTHGSPDFPIAVSATVEGKWLLLSVSNRGEPIGLEDIAHVFEPYWRPHTSAPGGGLGLGLFICTQIAKAHGGTMEVSFSEAEGTCFRGRLPIVLERGISAV